jgi:hypothetical protein
VKAPRRWRRFMPISPASKAGPIAGPASDALPR